ncbi:MAG TPA: DUF58 domain-containing protein, partial [Lacipirellulaceae bacterium]|nr:DUF58 domain-containing protein [Lacipirellulaceae bacterium]
MTAASKRSLRPEVIKRIGRLEIRARHIVEGLLSGMHRSPYFGQSVEFLQHREYAIGDDLRRVDWKVWAKQDRLYVKQFEEDTNLRCCLLVDTSASMEYGSGSLTKCDYAITAASALAYLLLRQQDAVGCAVFDETVRQTIPLRTSTSHLNTIVRALEQREPHDKTKLYDVLARVAETYPRRGMMVLISDLFVDPADIQRGLRLLRGRGHDVL